MAGDGKGTSKGSGSHTGHGRYGGEVGSEKYNLENDDDDSGDNVAFDRDRDLHGIQRPKNPLTVTRKKHNTENYDKMRNRNDILRDLYATYKEGGIHSDNLTVHVLLDIREILIAINSKI